MGADKGADKGTDEVDEEVQEGEEQNLNRGGREEASKKQVIGAPLPYNHHSLPSSNHIY